MRSALLSLPGFLLLAAPAAAESISSLDHASLRNDLSLRELFRSDVESMSDRRVGRLRDVLINEQGEITTAVVEFDEGIGNSGFAIALMEWSETALEPTDGAITISIGSDNQASDAFNTEGVPARDVIGRSVVLKDDEEFGTIKNILIDPRTRQPTAVLVAADDASYALPYPAGRVRQGDDTIRFDVSRENVEALGEFDHESD
ncbi:MAG: PRC-barrel domain-containing protein [Proteobacteria bacterium]|nr:PRC-barrel domain-containing protein [Pseudomonadota bacterium]